MPAFDPELIASLARLPTPPAGWQVRHLRRSAVLWDLMVRLSAALLLLLISALLVATAHPNGGDGAVPYVFAAFALLTGLAYLSAAWAPLQQLRRPEDYLLVQTPDGIALMWSARATGIPLVRVYDAVLRRRSFRAIFGQDLVLIQGDGTEVLLPIGELFGEPADILAAVIEGARRLRHLSSPRAE